MAPCLCDSVAQNEFAYYHVNSPFDCAFFGRFAQGELLSFSFLTKIAQNQDKSQLPKLGENATLDKIRRIL